MLDQQHRHAGLGQLAEQVAQLLALGVVEARGGLVEQEQARPGGQGAGQFEQAGLAGGQRVGRAARPGALSPTRASTPSALAAASERSWDQRRRISAAARTFSRTDSEPKTSRRWKVRAMPRRARWCGFSPVMSAPSKRDATPVEALQPADGVEAGGLAGAVGTDEAGDDAGRDVEVRRRAARGHPQIEPQLPLLAEAPSSPPHYGRAGVRAAVPGPAHLFPGRTRYFPSGSRTASRSSSYGPQFRAVPGERYPQPHGTLHGRTAGRAGRTQERGPPRREPPGGRTPPRQGQADRPRADRVPARRGVLPGARHAGPAPGPRHGPGGQPPLHRRRRHRLRHHRRAPGLPVQPGLHRLRRRPGRGLRREDPQGHGPGRLHRGAR